MKVIPVIMAGGSGTRLWPYSTSKLPKQFLSLLNEESMLQNTVRRLNGIDYDNVIVVCNEQHRFIVAQQLTEIGVRDAVIILEPEGRNTAPAIAISALQAKLIDPEALLLVLAADHVIQDELTFRDVVLDAQQDAMNGNLITFGITPRNAATAYGYIKCGVSHGHGYEITRFEEKPDLEKAQSYVASKDYLWNSGMFLFRSGIYLSELEVYQPEILKYSQKAFNGKTQCDDFIRLDKKAFASCPAISIDYAVMEHTKKGLIFPLDVGWDDIGSWSSLWELREKDENGNCIVGNVVCTDSKNNLLQSNGKLIAAVGVEDLIIVNTEEAVLIANKNNSQGIKQIAQAAQK